MPKPFLAVLLVCCSILFACGDGENSGADGPPVREGLIHYYAFNGDAQDGGSTPVHGTLSNATPCADRKGRTDGAVAFAGDGAVHLAFYALPDDCTIALWFRSAAGGGRFLRWRQLPQSPASSSQSFGLIDGYVSFSRSSGAIGGYASGTSTPTNDAWTHAVAVIAQATNLRLIVDGIEEKSDTLLSQSTALNTLLLGETLFGAIDELCIYDRVLSGDEIARLFFQ